MVDPTVALNARQWLRNDTLWRRFFPLLLLLWIGQSALATGSVPYGNGLLFRVQAAGAEPSYLFGTIHSEDKRVLALPGAVRSAFEKSDTLAVEITMEPANLLYSITAMVLSDGRSLSDILGPDLYEKCVQAAGTKGIPELALRQYKPWAVATLLSLPPVKSGEFLDLALYRRAQGQGKRVIGIETVEEQLEVFDSLTEADQIALLEDTLNNLDKLPMIYQELLDAYLNGDLEALMRLNADYLQGEDNGVAERFQKRIVDDRNHRMAERILPHLNRGAVFVAVGALHLPGEEGILNLIGRQGFKIERIY